MSFQADLEAEVTALVIATISGATSNNVYPATKAAKINILEAASQASPTVTFPFWIVDAGTAIPESKFGSQNNIYRSPLTIIEFRKTSGSNEKATIQADLDSLQQAIRNAGHTAFCVIEDGMISTSPSDAAVRSLLDTTLNAVAGTLSYSPGVLCGNF